MKTLWILALSLLLVSPAGADTPPRYRLTVLPLTFASDSPVDTAESHGGINQVGQIVGMVTVRWGTARSLRAALWQEGRKTWRLDNTPPVSDPDPSTFSLIFPTAINSDGMVCISSYHSFSGAYTVAGGEAYRWQNGQIDQLRGFPAGYDSTALGLNDKGWIVGQFIHNNYGPFSDAPPVPDAYIGRAFLYRSGRVIFLWPGVARGINNQGWIVGIKSVDVEDSHAKGVLWRSGRITPLKMQPTAINECGEIAGNIPINEDLGKACLWRQGKITHLTTQTSHAYALNNLGQVAGEEDSSAPVHPNRAVLWQDGRTYDLNRCVSLAKGWVLERAIGINDHGWIIGEGSVYKTPRDTQAAKSFTFLLTSR